MSEVVGRTREVDLVVVAVERGASLLIEGEPGIGKSSVLDAATANLLERGWDVEVVRAAWAARTVALMPFHHIDLGGLASHHPDEHLIRLGNALRGRARTGRFALMIDDAHALDDLSVALVHQLATVHGVSVVLTARVDPGLAPDLDGLRDAGRLSTLRLGSLDTDAVGALVEGRLDGALDPELVSEIARLSEGHPLLAVELVRAGRERETILKRDGVWHLVGSPGTTTRLRELIRSRLQAIDADTWVLLAAIAVAEAIGLDALDADDHDRVVMLERAGLVALIDEPLRTVVRVGHDLHREVILAGRGPDQRRARSRAIELLERSWPGREPDDLVRAARLRLANHQLDHDRLVRAARLSLDRFEAHDAVAFVDAALVERPTLDAHLVRAAALSGSGRAAAAEEVFRSLAASAADPTIRTRVVLNHAYDAVVRRGDVARAVQLLDDVLGGPSNDLTDDARGLLSMVHGYAGDLAGAYAVGQPFLERDEPFPLDAAPGMMAYLVVVGRPDEALDLLRRADAGNRVTRETPDDGVVTLSFMRLIAQWQVGLIGDREHPFAWVPRRAHAVVDAPLVRDAMAATKEVLRGHLGHASTAYARLEPTLGTLPGPYDAFNRILAANAFAGVGRIEDARRSIAAAMRTPEAGRRGFEFWLQRAEVAIVAASGDAPAAVERSIDLAERFADEWFHVCIALHDAARFGGPELVVGRLGSVVDATPTWWATRALAHAEASLGGDVGALVPIVDDLEAGGLDLYALEAACEVARLLAERSSPVEAEAWAVRTAELWTRCGPVRTPAVWDVPPRLLTDRELQVARLAAMGASNKEIADRLGTSVRTVGNQLQRAYDKLAVRGRSGLEPLVSPVSPEASRRTGWPVRVEGRSGTDARAGSPRRRS